MAYHIKTQRIHCLLNAVIAQKFFRLWVIVVALMALLPANAPKSSEQNILNEFLVKSVKCKPEAPWLNRVKGTIQFTEEIREINCESVVSSLKSESDEENSVFDSSYSELKVFRSAQVISGKGSIGQGTAQLFNYVKQKEKPSKAVIVDASEDVRRKIDSICSSNFDD